MFRFSFYPLFGSYWVVLTLAVILLFILITFRPGGERLPNYGRRCLLILRFTALLFLLFAMLRPTLVYTKSERLGSILNILLDQSESMARPDEFGGKLRFNAAKEALENVQPQLIRLKNQTEVKAYLFDSTLESIEIQNGILEKLPQQPQGQETAIGASLDAVRERCAGKRVLGTLILTDGTQRTRQEINNILPHNAAVRLRDAGIPLYTVPFGQSGGTADVQDVSLNDIQGNERIFVKNNFVVNGSVRITGYPNQPVPVQLFFEDETGKMQNVAETTVQSKGNGQLIPFRLTYPPPNVGYYKYTVKIPPQEKELVETNNEQSNFVRVIDGGLTVLYIQGERNLEQGPLRQALNASADIRVDYRNLRTGQTAAGLKTGESMQKQLESFTRERPSWVDDAFHKGAYNVYILDDIDSKAFKQEELKALAERVKEGSGLIMLGGLHSFGAGGYAETPLADISPVELRAVDRQPLDAPIRQDIHYPPPILMRLTPEGRRHYVLRLATNPLKNTEIWESLPPLAGANRLDKLKPGASLLIEGPDRQHLLVSQIYGLGRVLAFAGDSTYRWRLGGFIEEHKRFWRQVVLWLAKMEGVMEGDCWITLDSIRILPGDAANFRVFLQSSDKQELHHFSVNASVVKPNGNEENISMVNEEGTPAGSFRTTDIPGDYTIKAELTHESFPADAPTKTATARFIVQDQNLELDNPAASPQLLKNLAETTGGRSILPEQLGKLLDELIQKSDEWVEKRETKQPLYDSWGLLLVFCGVLCLEWFLRKYWGLV